MLSRKKKIAALNKHSCSLVHRALAFNRHVARLIPRRPLFESRDRSHQTNILIVLVPLLRITERTEHDENANYQDSTRRQARERCTGEWRLGCEEPQEKADNRLGWSLDIPSLGSDIVIANMEI